MQEVVSNPLPTSPSPKKGKRNLIIIIAVALAALLAAVFFIVRPFGIGGGQGEPTPTPTSTSEAPTPTPSRAPVDKTEVRIQVVNGTGTPGQASDVVETLTGDGYNEELIKTDNAEEFATTPTTITAREGFEAAAEDIQELLKSSFDEVTIDSSPLEDSSEFDIVIVTGGEEYEEPTSAPTPTGSSSTTTPTTTPTPTPTP